MNITNVILIIGLLIIPAIGLEVGIVEVPIVNYAYDMSVVGNNQVGHLEGTGWPLDNTFLTYIAAHNYLAFEDLDKVSIGDVIYITTEGYMYTYEVVDIKVVHFSDTSYLSSPVRNSLILQTCIGNTEWRLLIYALQS